MVHLPARFPRASRRSGGSVAPEGCIRTEHGHRVGGGSQPVASAATSTPRRHVEWFTTSGDVPVRRHPGSHVTVVHRTAVRSAATPSPDHFLIRMVRGYQRAAEGRPSPCRFSPTCSAYAIEALQVHGTLRGLRLTLRRLVRCRPFGPSGWDPVPQACEDHRSHTHRHGRFRQKGYAA